MKRHILMACALLAAGVTAWGQGANEALLFGENNYYGTARTVAMGNAFTALGGDLGSVGINPAGSAVNNWSQFTITPALSISGSSASFNDGSPYKTSETRVNLPNVGGILNFNTHRTSGLKAVTFGFVMNATGIWNKDFTAAGKGTSSYMGYLADMATRANLSAATLNGSLSDLSTAYWLPALGYQSGMVNEATGVAGAPYISPAQLNSGSGNYPLRGEINQQYGQQMIGRKQDMVFNLGFNIANRVFIGANLGMIFLSNRMNEYIRETALNPEEFPVTIQGESDSWTDMKFSYEYNASGSGVYGKFGIIAVPVDGLRIGAAIQTPTAMNIQEYRWYDALNNFKGAEGKASADYEYRYRLRLPARYNFGIAWTLGQKGLVSFDYELTDFSTARYREARGNDHSGFDGSNAEVTDYLGMAHYFRLGAEYKIIPQFAIRAGYNLGSNPNREYDENGIRFTPSAWWHTGSLGIGYSSSGSFFCDFALRCKINPTDWNYPYPTADAPEIAVNNRLWDAVLTFGLRF